jgi:hypothetical protein
VVCGLKLIEMADIQDKTKLGSPSPGSSPRLGRKEASPAPSGGGGVSPFSQRKREAETLQEAITATALPGDPPLLPGELLSFIAHDITYLDPFLGARTGSLYITDYKMYFKSPSDDKAVSVSLCLCLCLSLSLLFLFSLPSLMFTNSLSCGVYTFW